MTSTSHTLDKELVTVEAVRSSGGTTWRVDAFTLMWVKAEKQISRLFCFLVFRSPAVSHANREDYVSIIVTNPKLSFDSLIKCFDALSPTSLKTIVGSEYDEFREHIERMRKYRNKLLHGQFTGQKIKSKQLEEDIGVLRRWVETLACSCACAIGYDGIGRDTFPKAKHPSVQSMQQYPFSDAAEFKRWLACQTKQAKQKT